MAKRKPVTFELIPLEDVPIRNVANDPPADELGSAFDRLLTALQRVPGQAAKVTTEDTVPLDELSNIDRERIQSGIITIAKNRGVKVMTLCRADAVYAWISED